MGKALVTGASGFLGSRVARQLVERGDDVKVLLRPGSSRRALAGLPVEIAEGDISVGHTVYRALAGCDRVYHVAAVYKMWDRDPQNILRPSIEGTREVMEAIARRGSAIEKVVVTSSVAAIGSRADGTPMTEEQPWDQDDAITYVVAKRRAEEVALSYAKTIPVTVVCPGGIFGPGDAKPTPSGQIIVRYLNWSAPFAFPGGPTGISIVDVDDVARGHLAAMEKGRVGERYILGGDNLTLTQMIETLSGITGLPGPGAEPSQGAVSLIGTLSELWARISGSEPEITAKMSETFAAKLWVSSAKAERELGYTFRSARKTLARSVRWYLDRGYIAPERAAVIRYDELPGPDPLPSLPHERNAVFAEG
jgi:dihydroflavonol-4-reductase